MLETALIRGSKILVPASIHPSICLSVLPSLHSANIAQHQELKRAYVFNGDNWDRPQAPGFSTAIVTGRCTGKLIK